MYFFRLSISIFALNMLFFKSLLFEFRLSERFTCSLAWKIKYRVYIFLILPWNRNSFVNHSQLWATLPLPSIIPCTCSTGYFSSFASICSADSFLPNTRSCSNRCTTIPATEGGRIRPLCARYPRLILGKEQPNCRAVYRCSYRCTLKRKRKKKINK